MNDLVLEPTVKSPLFEFSPKGILVIEGKAISIQSEEDFKPAIRWCEGLRTSHVFFMVKLDYLNMASTRQMVRLLNTLHVNTSIKSLDISWYYHREDEQVYETGQVLSEILPQANFQFFSI